ncbi:MAG TPA: ferredoxin [Lachnospiraceae bacterium]|jgi:[FeFe] hydrogenase (group B1/B3)|nr:ferredoxin [Lachnospiraceae bacterium]HCA69498.1 ferredoxin [Lachnospiraceae bacterium]HCM12673.1 ferredoxin [Lachnospiraceae bacterium]HCR39821.1 ferredoxin [Lachnospiraceae bacterium]
MIRKFDTKVQHLKYKVLREVARSAFQDDLHHAVYSIPQKIVQGPEATMRCCIYKERAIVGERINIAMGGNAENPNVIEVLDIACDECPVGGYEVSDACRGCIAHRCEDVCKRNAITFDKHQKAHIDKEKCVECGRCAQVCPYTAIRNQKRPCQNACKVKAISMDDNKKALIDNNKCISCGACVYQCPFGAIMDKSQIVDVVNLIKESHDNRDYKLYAVVAPSIASQFSYANLGQIISAIKKLGFYTVIEAALGADMVADSEADELIEKGFLTSSCCPAFVDYIKKQFPAMVEHISHNPSPMTAISRYIKKTDPTSKVVFIGPCTAKKMELKRPEVAPYVDNVITFEELQALIDSRDINLEELPLDSLDNASYFGRIFARSGGLSEAVKEAIKEKGIEDFDLNPIACDGIEACRTALLKASKKVLPNNFIEGMACIGGCIGGAGCLTHGEKNKKEVDDYGKESLEKTIQDAIAPYKN